MNILIVGLGSIARKHLDALKSINNDLKIYALRSNINATIEKNIENIHDLDNCRTVFDFAIISNPTYLHCEYIKILSYKGIPLFIEKPAIHNLEMGDELIGLIEEKKILTYVACNLRFHPCIKFLKDKIESEDLIINELNIYCGSYLPDWRPGKEYREIYSANASMGGGVHLDLIHELDYTTWLFGFPSVSKSVLKSISSLNIESIDYANYILEYEKFTATVILNYFRRKPKREIEIVLDKETWKVDLIKNEIVNENNELLFQDLNFNIKETYVKQLEYFINCLSNNQIPMNNFVEAFEVLKICLKHD